MSARCRTDRQHSTAARSHERPHLDGQPNTVPITTKRCSHLFSLLSDHTDWAHTLNSSSAPNLSMDASSSLPNSCLAPSVAALGPRMVRPLVSMRWMTRWSNTIFCLARFRMSSSTLPLVKNLQKQLMLQVHDGMLLSAPYILRYLLRHYWSKTCRRDLTCVCMMAVGGCTGCGVHFTQHAIAGVHALNSLAEALYA